MRHTVRLAQLEAAVRERREAERRRLDRSPITMTTGERRRRLAELTYIDRHGRDPTVDELNAYQASSEYEADSRQRDAEFDAWRAAMPGAAVETWRPFLASEAGKAAVAAQLIANDAEEAERAARWAPFEAASRRLIAEATKAATPEGEAP